MLRLLISLGLFAVTFTVTAIAETETTDQDPIVVEFGESCIVAAQANDVSIEADEFNGWWSVPANVNASLESYFATVSDLLGDKISFAAHYTKRVRNRQIFLTRYAYTGSFGITSHVCMVSDFSRETGNFPFGFDHFLSDKILETEFSTVRVEGEKTVGQWRTRELLQPVSKITASAFAKNSADHAASGFYGLQLTSVKTDIQETEDNLN